ncbi:MAG: hypothetical protein HZA61_09805 [Candidatus Eisenbacteria bacterium]|uniref:Uncharacterized protein n=1 Tax=Eiseniibacteriota bacterium TaxID=2212470 RepID=A0A933SDM3_UNCEI|nr:hypothetical protein [Candidatus Eisenbacteria bacterium]
MNSMPVWAAVLAALLLIALLERTLAQLFEKVADGVRALLGPARAPERGLADVVGGVAGTISGHASEIVKRYQLDAGKLIGGVLLTGLFVFAAAIETALMKVALELVLPFDDTPFALGAWSVSPAVAVAVALLTIEAVVAMLLLVCVGMTDLFAWDRAWPRSRRLVVAVGCGVVLLALIGIQAGLAWLRLSQPDVSAALGELAANGVASAYEPPGQLARVLGSALSALVPVCATAGALGVKLLLVALLAGVLALAAVVVRVAQLALAAVTAVVQFAVRLLQGVLRLFAWPGRTLIDALDALLGAARRPREARR